MDEDILGRGLGLEFSGEGVEEVEVLGGLLPVEDGLLGAKSGVGGVLRRYLLALGGDGAVGLSSVDPRGFVLLIGMHLSFLLWMDH